MRSFRYLITIIAFFSAACGVFAQQNTLSPYSRFGIGDISNKGFGRSAALGGTGIGLRSGEHLNYLNPASYTAQDTMSFLFDVGVTSNYTLFESSAGEHQIASFYPGHLAIGFPVTSWWKSSIGLLPYSKVGYKVEDDMSVEDVGLVDYFFEGSGGINRFYVGNAFQLHENISVGFDISYLFGSLTRSSSASFPFDEHAFETKSRNRVMVSDFHLKYGLQYSGRINEDYSFTAGVVFENSRSLKASNDMLVVNELELSEGFVQDTIYNFTGEKDHIDIPMGIGAGFSVKRGNNLVFAADYTTHNWADSRFLGVRDSLANSSMFKTGIEYTNDPGDYDNLLRRTTYRLGFHYENTYLQFNDRQLKDYGVTLGFGIPYRGRETSFNFAIDIGQRGTTSDNLIRENYVIFSFSASLYDFWFIQRRYE